MHIRARTFFRSIALFAALSIQHSAANGQEPKLSPAAPTEPTTESKASDQPPAPAPAPAPDFWKQDTLTGDWSGTRSHWKEKGVELDFAFTQFGQGVAAGGIETGAAGTGRFQSAFKFDLGKIAGWKFWSLDFKTETRFGGPLLGGTGTISPVNTAAIIPAAAGSAFTISSLNLTKIFPIDLQKGDLIALSFGRFNLLDLSDEHFFGGGGIDRFWNIAQIGPLTVLREVPFITNLVSFAYIRHGEPIFTFALLDPNDHSLNPGLKDLFADGVTFSPGINLPAKYFGKTAKHSFGAAVTTKNDTPFDAIRQIVIPGPPVHPVQPERGSWSVNYTFRQYIVEKGKDDGWGFFGQVAFANQSTSPISKFANVGIGGNGLFKNRRKDEFGIAYAYTDFSDTLKNNVDPLSLGRLLAEHQGEIFYNFHITPWLRFTPDLQVIRPTRPVANVAIIPGVRLELIL
jgi:porin